MSLPTLLPENQIRPFNYYWEGQVRSGMTARGQLYALLDCFSENNRAIAYEKGCELAESYDVVVTVTQEIRPKYHLWVALTAGMDKSLLADAVADKNYSLRQI
ncbi:MAG: hypothetical protein AAGE59_13420 [Cyanobacteria bacterium P01_F01_bin.86]